MSEHEHLEDRAVIRISGDDRRAFLQGLITQDVERISDGRAIFSALLTPQGKILFDFFITETNDTLLIDCAKETAPALLKRLSLYKLRAKVALKIDETLSVHAHLQGTNDSAVATYQDPRTPALGWRRIASDAFSTGDASAYHARRIAFGAPEFSADYSADETFLTDVNYDALNGVDYKKGCFIGQEVTSRMKRKGDIRKRTILAAYDGPAPEKGAAIKAGASTLGEILSAKDGAALALVRLDRWEKARTANEAPICEDRSLKLSLPAYLKQE